MDHVYSIAHCLEICNAIAAFYNLVYLPTEGQTNCSFVKWPSIYKENALGLHLCWCKNKDMSFCFLSLGNRHFCGICGHASLLDT